MGYRTGLGAAAMLVGVLAGALGLAGCGGGRLAALHEESVVERSGDARPAWTTRVPEASSDTLYAVGRARAQSENGAVVDAREGASRELVDTYYGATLKKEYTRIRTELRDQLVSRLSSRSEGRIAGARTKEVFWERVRVQGRGQVSYVYRAWVLVAVDRARLEAAIGQWIAASPQVVEARALARQAPGWIADELRLVAEALAAASARRLSDVAQISARVEALEARLDSAERRHQALLGRPLPADRAEARRAVERLRTRSAVLARGIRIGVTARVDAAAGADSKRVADLVTAAVAPLGVAAEAGAGARCRAGWTHHLAVTVAAPRCRRPGMGQSCDLVLDLALFGCPGGASLDTGSIGGESTRGAAMTRDKALARAWHTIEAGGAVFRQALSRFLSRHVPVRAGGRP